MTLQDAPTIPPFFNKVMSTLLRSPMHGLVSKSIMLITFTGRKSGKTYTTPVSYSRNGDLVTAFTHAKWWRNLVGGVPVTLIIKHKTFAGQADVVSDDKEVIASNLKQHLSQVRSDARFYQVTFDENGEPNWTEVQRAAQEAVMLQIKLDDIV